MPTAIEKMVEWLEKESAGIRDHKEDKKNAWKNTKHYIAGAYEQCRESLVKAKQLMQQERESGK